MTGVLFLETASKEQQLKKQGKRRLNVAGVLRKLGVSRSRYLSWMHRLPSESERRKAHIKERIFQVYHDSYQNYGAPKITKSLQEEGFTIAERTVGKQMKELWIKAQYIRPYTVTTIDPDFSAELENILNVKKRQKKCSAVILKNPIHGIMHV